MLNRFLELPNKNFAGKFMAQKIKKCQISIIAPVYNESKNLSLFYERTKNVLVKMKKTFEIIFINDGSKDDSLEHLINIHKNIPFK